MSATQRVQVNKLDKTDVKYLTQLQINKLNCKLSKCN